MFIVHALTIRIAFVQGINHYNDWLRRTQVGPSLNGLEEEEIVSTSEGCRSRESRMTCMAQDIF